MLSLQGLRMPLPDKYNGARPVSMRKYFPGGPGFVKLL